jgi:hypothetical protein
MSGGSFDYAYSVDGLSELLSKRGAWESLASALEDAGADDVAAEVDAMLQYATLAERRVQARLTRLEGIAKAIEWWYSNDRSEADFRAELAAWRKKYTGIEE